MNLGYPIRHGRHIYKRKNVFMKALQENERLYFNKKMKEKGQNWWLWLYLFWKNNAFESSLLIHLRKLGVGPHSFFLCGCNGQQLPFGNKIMQIKWTWPASKKPDLSKVNRRYCILNYCCYSYLYLFLLKLFL